MLGLSTLKMLALRAYPLHVPQLVALQPEHEVPDEALPWIPDPWKAKTETLRSSSMLWQYLHTGVSSLFLKKSSKLFPHAAHVYSKIGMDSSFSIFGPYL
jgi:hypothetical protein